MFWVVCTLAVVLALMINHVFRTHVALDTGQLKRPPRRKPQPPRDDAERAARAALQKDVTNLAREDFARATDVAKSLDTRAQATITASGIFLAGFMALVRDLTLPTAKRPADAFILAIAVTVILLASAIVSSVLALRTSWLPRPLPAELVRWLSALCYLDMGRLPDFYGQVSHEWERINTHYWNQVRRKGALVSAAQTTLLFAGLAAATAVLNILFVSWRS